MHMYMYTHVHVDMYVYACVSESREWQRTTGPCASAQGQDDGCGLPRKRQGLFLIYIWTITTLLKGRYNNIHIYIYIYI